MKSTLHQSKAKRFLTLFALAFGLCSTIQAQDFQGKAVYMSKTKMEFNLEGRNIPAAQREMIEKRMKEFSEKTFELDFDRTGSIYQEQAKLETPGAGGGGGGFRMAFAGGGGGIYYKNIQEKGFKNQTELFGKIFLISDSLNQWDWKLGSETKKIGNYTCYKATAIRKRDTTMMERFRRMARRGRRGQGQNAAQKDSVQKDSTDNNSLLSRIEKEPTEDTITAWFTPEIPVSQGPGPYWGLPGLILEVSDGRTALLCTKITLNPEDKKAIAAPKKGKVVTQEEYNEIMADKMEEMSERFRGGNRRGGNTIRIRG